MGATGLTPEYAAFAADHPVPRGRGTLTGRVAIERRTQQIDDVLADPDYDLPEFQRLGGYRSIIGAPMIVDDEVVGVLTVWRTTVEPFDEHTRTLLTTFAEQAALALRNVELLSRRCSRGRPSWPARSTRWRRWRRSGRRSARPSTRTRSSRRSSSTPSSCPVPMAGR